MPDNFAVDVLEIRTKVEAWWVHDGLHARTSNTYLRHGENRARAAEACFDDFEAGLYDAFAVLSAGKPVSPNKLVQRYEKRTKGQRIDVHSYRLGVQRMAQEYLNPQVQQR